MKVLVLGAGIIGVTTAWYLNRAGHQVQVLEQGAEVATGCSFANGGQLSYSYTEPFAGPNLPGMLPRLLRAEDAPLVIQAAALPGLLPWALRLARNCTAQRFAFNTTNILRLALYSRTQLEALRTVQPLEFNYQHHGKLHLYGDEAALAKATQVCELKKGCGQQVLSPAQCLAREPALASLRHRLAGAVFSPLDASGDTLQFARGLARLAEAAGVQFHYDTRIQGMAANTGAISAVHTRRGTFKADAYVVCLGACSGMLTRTLGLKLPIYPGKGYSFTVTAGDGCPRVNITDTRYRLVYSRLGDNLRVAGVMEFAGNDLSVGAARIQTMLKRAMQTFPHGGHYPHVRHPWAGLRPLTPDSAPIIGPTRYPNLYLNTGHGMLGWTLACGSARVVADIVSGNRPEIDLTGLALARSSL